MPLFPTGASLATLSEIIRLNARVAKHGQRRQTQDLIQAFDGTSVPEVVRRFKSGLSHFNFLLFIVSAIGFEVMLIHQIHLKLQNPSHLIIFSVKRDNKHIFNIPDLNSEERRL